MFKDFVNNPKEQRNKIRPEVKDIQNMIGKGIDMASMDISYIRPHKKIFICKINKKQKLIYKITTVKTWPAAGMQVSVIYVPTLLAP